MPDGVEELLVDGTEGRCMVEPHSIDYGTDDRMLEAALLSIKVLA